MSVLSVRLTTGASPKSSSLSALTLLPLHAATTNSTPMKHYISHLRKVSRETLPKPKLSQNLAELESLEKQIRRWWINLPPVMRQRPFQIVEIAAQCKGRYRDKPALREVAVALRAQGWTENRNWSVAGRNRRQWSPPESF
jgi:hypothetical protein